MLVISNRSLDAAFEESGIGDHKAFGEQLNPKGPTEIRLATANLKSGKWKVELCKEPDDLHSDNLPSKQQFDLVLKRCKKAGKNCLFFVHGYNKPFVETLEQGWRLQKRYKLEVVVFSWPSNTGGFPLAEYRDVKRVARTSTGALDSALEKLAKYLAVPFNRKALDECDVKLSLMLYSMGNFLFQNYVEGAHYDAETRMFNNVVLCQADCDNEDHGRWVEEIQAGKHIYITINENDKILKWSDLNFQKDRLGRTVRDLHAENSIYVDFTDGAGVDDTHQLWGKDTNTTVKEFFDRALNGGRGEDIDGLTYDVRVNAFRSQ
jgi:esterase/lipase superfamily enzyme